EVHRVVEPPRSLGPDDHGFVTQAFRVLDRILDLDARQIDSKALRRRVDVLPGPHQDRDHDPLVLEPPHRPQGPGLGRLREDDAAWLLLGAGDDGIEDLHRRKCYQRGALIPLMLSTPGRASSRRRSWRTPAARSTPRRS